MMTTQPNCHSNFLAVKPKTEGFNTILTTKLNDHVLIMASFEQITVKIEV